MSGQDAASQDKNPDSGRGYGRRGCGDGRTHSEDHQDRVQRLHGVVHCSPTQHGHGLRQVIYIILHIC